MAVVNYFKALQRYREDLRRLAKLAAQTEKALTKGSFERAEELARRREAIIRGLAATHIEDPKTGRLIVSRQVAQRDCWHHLLKAHNDILLAMEGQKFAALSSANQARARAKYLEGVLAELSSELDQLEAEGSRLDALKSDNTTERQDL